MRKIRNIAIVVIVLGLIGIIFEHFSGDIDKALVSGTESSSPKEQSSSDSVSAGIEVTPLQDFNYTFDGTTLTLNNYNGDSSTVYISNEYDIDGTVHLVENVEGSMFLKDSVKTVIFSDGIQRISNAFFNGAEVETLYIPTSFTMIYDDTLAYISDSIKDIYYGGTQEQWNQIFTIYDPKTVSENLDAKNYEGAGEAIADKINSAIGHSFDQSTVTFHFESTHDDLLVP